MKESTAQKMYCFFIYSILAVVILFQPQQKIPTQETFSQQFYLKQYPLMEVPVFSLYTPLHLPIDKRKIRIAIVDSGVDFTHPLLADFKAPNQNEYNTTDPLGHGTHVAGILAYHLRQVFGSVAPHLFEFASFRYNPQSYSNILSYNIALLDTINWQPDLVNISLSGDYGDYLEKLIIQTLVANNAKIIVAAGNEGSPFPQFPCGYSNVICVGNLQKDFKMNPSSNYGTFVSHYAIGTDILSSLPNFSLGHMTGTSQAAPLVTAAFASLEFSDLTPLYFSDKVFHNVHTNKQPLAMPFQKPYTPFSISPASLPLTKNSN